ncbi:MAG: peptide-methionine (S)-S-oxide reductase MsrA [Eubacteriales bacterium]|nr:peptide-methionine (S)-S-oxide reductase MsrA [Eubacteriales bacterium]
MTNIYLAGGCFWGVQKFFDQFAAVEETETGYANGETENPTYEEVCWDSGHAETVKVVFDEQQLSLTGLLHYYFRIIDPISVNRQGFDVGKQYRTGIYYDDPSLLPEIRAVIEEQTEKVGQPLAVEVMPLENYYTAEPYHQKYLDRIPTGYCHIKPYLMHLEEKEGSRS